MRPGGDNARCLEGPNAPSLGLPALGLPSRLRWHTEAITWEVGRLCGFQACNLGTHATLAPPGDGKLMAAPTQSNPVPVPATLSLAADHVNALLGCLYARLVEGGSQAGAELRLPADPSQADTTLQERQDQAYKAAVLQLHCTIFSAYTSDWCPKVGLQPLPATLRDLHTKALAGSWQACHACLTQLALYHLMWVEGANLRHMGEVLWFLHWTLLHSPAVTEYACSSRHPPSPSATHPPHLTHLLHGSAFYMAVRTTCDQFITSARQEVGLAKPPEPTITSALVPAGPPTLMPAAVCADSLKQYNMELAAPLLSAMKAHVQGKAGPWHEAVEALAAWCRQQLRSGGADQAVHISPPPAHPLPTASHAPTAKWHNTHAQAGLTRDAGGLEPAGLGPIEEEEGGARGTRPVTSPPARGLADIHADHAGLRPDGGAVDSHSGWAGVGEAEGGGETRSAPAYMEIEEAVMEAMLSMALHGDGGWVLERVTTPLFLLLAHEMDVLSQEDVAYRLGYDDVNESLCSQPIVYGLLRRLGLSRKAILLGESNSAFAKLSKCMGQPAMLSAADNAVNCPDKLRGWSAAGAAVINDNGSSTTSVHVALTALAAPVFDAKGAANFWSSQVCVKTFLEVRSWWAVFRVFWRVWALNTLGLHALMVLAFVGLNPLALSSLVPMHAILVALERWSQAWVTRPGPNTPMLQKDIRAASELQRQAKKGTEAAEASGIQRADGQGDYTHPSIIRVARGKMRVEGAPLLGVLGWLEPWLLAAGLVALYAWVCYAWAHGQEGRVVLVLGRKRLSLELAWWWLAALYTGVKVLHWLLTLGPGIQRSLRGLLRLPSWLDAYSRVPDSTCYTPGSLSIGLGAALLQALAWILVYGFKFAFEYWVVCLPLVKPVRALLATPWPAVFGLTVVYPSWLLVVVRVAPLVLLAQIDGMLAYQLLLSVWTLARGLLSKDLISLHSWTAGDLARDFHNAPARWWAKGTSRRGRVGWSDHSACPSVATWHQPLAKTPVAHAAAAPSPAPRPALMPTSQPSHHHQSGRAAPPPAPSASFNVMGSRQAGGPSPAGHTQASRNSSTPAVAPQPTQYPLIYPQTSHTATAQPLPVTATFTLSSTPQPTQYPPIHPQASHISTAQPLPATAASTMTPAIPPLCTPLPVSHPAPIASAPIAFAPTIAPHTAQSMTQPPPPSEATQASWAAWASDEPGQEAGAEDHWMNRWSRAPDKKGGARKTTVGALNSEKTGQQQAHPSQGRQVSAPGSGVDHGGAGRGGSVQLPRMSHETPAVTPAGQGRFVNGVWVAAGEQQTRFPAILPQPSHSSGHVRAPPHPPAAPQPPQPLPAPPVWDTRQPASPKHDRPRERLARAEPTPENAFVRTARQWRAFAVAWTALVDDLRQSDMLSDGETAHLRLVDTSGVKSWAVSACAFGSQGQRIPEVGIAGSVAPHVMDPQAVGNELETCLGPVLLPGLVHAGLVQRLIDGGGSGAGTRQATLSLSQLRGVTLSLLLGLGLVLPEEVPVLKEMGSYWEARPVSAQHQHEREELLSAAQHFAQQLMQWCPGHVSVESPQPRELLRYAKIVVKALILEVQKAHSSAWWSSTKATLKGQLAVLEAMQARLAGMQDAALRQCLARLRLVAPAALSQEGPMRGGGSSFAPGGSFWGNDHVSATTFSEVLVGSLVALLSLQPSEALPRNKDARSALATFLNSLAMKSLKEPVSLAATPSLVTLTPLYHEDVLYPLDAHALAAELSDMRRLKFTSEAERQATLAKWAAELPDLVSADRPEGDASVSIIDYLKSIHGDEFMNFTERVARQAGLSPVDAARITEYDFAAGGALHAWAVELQLWASYRSQVASRTVKGMECYQRALRVLASIEHPVSPAPDARAEAEAERDRWLEKLMETKYYHVLTAQEYGKQRASPRLKDAWNARSMELLLARHHSALRIAFVAGNEQLGQASYSVLLRARPQPSTPAAGGAHNSLVPHSVLLEEQYRVRMPANPYTKRGVILGEGKPENQNHAVIFCLGEAVQVIDMNQDNRLSEALKMRSVLQELQLAGDSQLYNLLDGLVNGEVNFMLSRALLDLAQHRAETPPVSMVGMKEWIFSNRSGALGAFAACTEYAFSSVIQRCMTGGGVRLHYGHPDVFNRQQVMTRGGLSKATRTLHVSEDVFSGMGHLLRGGKNAFVEHSSVGKGRDMGFASILGFESKISAGNAQVFLSREMARLTSRLDIFRLLHFYHSGLGYFTTALLTMAALKLQVLCLVVIPLAGVAMLPQPDGSRIATVSGLIANLPWVAQNLLDAGLLATVTTWVKQFLAGSMAFYGFRMQTTAWHFFSGVTYPGSAAYVATGRGFALLPVSFNTLYGQYGRSHLLPGAELAALLCSAGILLTKAGFSLAGIAALTWPLWMQCVCMLFAPFWFSPQAFQWDKVHQDWGAWRRWVLGGEPDPVMGSWSTWNRNTLASTRNWQGQHTGMLGTAVLGLIVDAGPPALLAGMAAVRLLLLQPYAAAMLGGTLLLWLVLGLMAAMRAFRLHYGKERSWQRARVVCIFLLVIACIGHIVALVVWLKTTGLSPINTTLLLHVCLILTAHRFALHMLPALRWAWLVDGGFWLEDAAVGGVLLSVVSLLTLGGLVTKVQQVLLTNLKYARCVREGQLTHAMLKSNKGGLTKLARPAGGPGGRGPGGTGPSGPGARSTTVSRAGGGSSMLLSSRATELVKPADEALSATALQPNGFESAVALGRQRLDVEGSRLSATVSISHTLRPSTPSTQQATAGATGAAGDVEDSPPYIPAYDDSDNELHEDLAAEMDAAIEEAERGARRAETMKPVGSLAKMLTMKRGSLRSIMRGAAEPATVAPGHDAEKSAAPTTTAANEDKTVDWLRSQLNADWGTRDAQQAEQEERQPLALPGSLTENSSSLLGTSGRRSRPHPLSRIMTSLGQLGATLPRAFQPASPATQHTPRTAADMPLALPPAGQGWTSGVPKTLSGSHSSLIRRINSARAAEGAENGELVHTSSFLHRVAAAASRLGSTSARQNASTSQGDPAPSVHHSRAAEAAETDNSAPQ